MVYYTEHAARLPGKLQDLVRNGTHLHVSVNGNECFNEAPDRNRLAEHFGLDPDADLEILDKAIIQFLAGAIFFQGIRFRYYGEPLSFDSEYAQKQNLKTSGAQ